MTDPGDVRRTQEWIARQAFRSAWTAIAVSAVALVAGVALLLFGRPWGAGVVGGALAGIVLGLVSLGNARRTKAAFDQAGERQEDDSAEQPSASERDG